MTALEQVIQVMQGSLVDDRFIEEPLLKESIKAHINLAKSFLSIEKVQLESEYQRGCQSAQKADKDWERTF